MNRLVLTASVTVLCAACVEQPMAVPVTETLRADQARPSLSHVAGEPAAVVNPENGHAYAALEPTSWMGAETQAVLWGGHLVTINDAAEEEWLHQTFGVEHRYWIGLNDRDAEGVWVWSSGETPEYSHWCRGEPNDSPPGEDAAVMNSVLDPTSPACWNDLIDAHHHRAIIEKAIVLAVSIDIKPGSDPNSINARSGGVIPVAILGSASFDVRDVDSTTLTFGPGGAHSTHSAGGHVEDVNGDGFDDLVSHYPTQDSGLSKADTEACVAGVTTGRVPIRGCDAVNIVG